jgi:hypothetical protein
MLMLERNVNNNDYDDYASTLNKLHNFSLPSNDEAVTDDILLFLKAWAYTSFMIIPFLLLHDIVILLLCEWERLRILMYMYAP